MCMLAILTGFSACSSDNNDGDKQMTNYVSISAAGNTIINEDDDEEVKFKCDLLVSFKIEDKIQSYFIKYIDKDYDIRRYMELIKKFDTFVKDEELVDRYCIISDKKPKLVFIADTQELMQDLFNTIINYDIDFNNICLSCLDVIFKDKEYKTFKEEDVFLDIAAYV